MRFVQMVVIVAVVAAACGGRTQATSTTPAATGAAPSTTTALSDEMITTTAPATEPLPLGATPAQSEGPYYPVQSFEDQDSDLTIVDGAEGPPSGNVLILDGLLLTSVGAPVVGGVVEIWQTDANGIYLHPGDPGLVDRDPFFQGFGAATAAADGSWSFRTIDPGYYEPRPRHIHVKVHLDGKEVLTTQIYFSDDPQAAGLDELLVATITAGTDDGGNEVLLASHRIVLDVP